MAATPIIVTGADIKVASNGLGGYILTYYGNNRWWSWELKTTNPLHLDVALDTVVSQLNSVPITSTVENF